MDMRLPAGMQAAVPAQAAHADAPPPLRLLQRWQPAATPQPPVRLPRWRLKLQQLFSA